MDEIRQEEPSAEDQMRGMSRRSFTWAAVATASTVGALKWVSSQPSVPQFGDSKGIPGPLRRVLDFNGQLSQSLAANRNMAETYPRSASRPPRVNGRIGLGSDEAGHVLQVQGWPGARTVTLDEIMALPKTEVVTKFKCIEGWSTVVQAAGCRFSDFMAALKSPTGRSWSESDLAALPQFAYLATPGEDYYVGLDMKALLHPQTLLAWEMDGRPLASENGAPLRLFIPTKYGIKNIKRVGLVRFQDERPTDYWYERGYDWYAGH